MAHPTPRKEPSIKLIYPTLTAALLVGLLAACGAAMPAPLAPTRSDLGTAAVSPTAVAQAAATGEPSPTPAAAASPTATAGPPATVAFPTANPKPECVADPIPEDPNIPPVTASDWSKGSADAPIALIEYGDFQ